MADETEKEGPARPSLVQEGNVPFRTASGIGNSDDMVIAVVPKAFKLTHDMHQVFEVKPGTQYLPRWVVEHWYAKANGVTEFQETGPAEDNAPSSLDAGNTEPAPKSGRGKKA